MTLIKRNGKSRLCLAAALLPIVFSASCEAKQLTRPTKAQHPTVTSGPQVEQLDRGLIAVPTKYGNYLSWRLLARDPETVSFDVYRNGQKINHSKLTDVTSCVDEQGTASDRYQVKAFYSRQHNRLQPPVGGTGVSDKVTPWTMPYLSVPLVKPEDGWIKGQTYSYSANDTSVADLDGDGQYEILVKWYPSNAKDNSQAGDTGPTLIDAYTLEGEQLWRIDLGPNIRSGAHYTQCVAQNR